MENKEVPSGEKSKSNKSLFALYALIIVIALSVIGVYMIASGDDKPKKNNPQNNSQNQAQDVLSQVTAKLIEIDINDQKQNKQYFASFKDGSSAFDALKDLQDQDKSFKFEYKQYDFGVMLTSMNGLKPDSSHFWKFQINGQDSQVGISDYKVKQGDKLTFILDSIQL